MIKYRTRWALTKEGTRARLRMALSAFFQTFVTTPSERRAEFSSPEPITSGGDSCPLRTSPGAAHGTSALDDSSRGLTSFHTPPTFKKNSTGERQRADGVEGRNGVSRSRGQESSPALARGRADRACELDGRRFESREGPEGVSPEVAGSRLAGDPGADGFSSLRGANRRLAALRAISRRFSKTLYFGAARAYKALNLTSWACRQSVKPVLLTAQPWLSHRSGRPGTRPEKPGAIWGGSSRYAPRLSADHNESLGSFRCSRFPRSGLLYAMQALTPLRSKENSPKNLPACLPVERAPSPKVQADRNGFPANVAELRSDEERRRFPVKTRLRRVPGKVRYGRRVGAVGQRSSSDGEGGRVRG
jgi:hypothetical protein